MITNELLTIVKATYAGGYKIVAKFSNGETRMLDFSEIVSSGKGVCKRLANIDYFKNFSLDPFTIDWNNEIGFDPEYLYEISRPIPKYSTKAPFTDNEAFVAEDLSSTTMEK